MLHCQKSPSIMKISHIFQHFHSKLTTFYAGKMKFSTNSPPSPSSNSSSMKNKKIGIGQSNIKVKDIDPNDPFNWEPTEKQRRILAFIGFFKSKEDVPKQLSFRVYNRYNRRIRFLQLFFMASFFVIIVGVFHFYAEYSINKVNRGEDESLAQHFQKDIRHQIYEAAANEAAAQRRKSSKPTT